MPLPRQKTCRHCGAEFALIPGKPGLIDECPNCVRDDVDLLGGNMVWHHKTAPTIEIKPLGDARRFAAKTARGVGGVLRCVSGGAPKIKEDRSAYSSFDQGRTAR